MLFANQLEFRIKEKKSKLQKSHSIGARKNLNANNDQYF